MVLTAACNHDPDPIPGASASDPVIAQHSKVVVNNNTIDEDFTIVWSPARYGSSTAVEYTLYVKSDGSYMEVGTTTSTNYTLPNSALFEMMDITLTGDYTMTFMVEAHSMLGDKASRPLAVDFEYTKTTYMWIFGAYQGWGPANPSSRLLQDANGIFKGYLQLPEGQLAFKFCSQPNWDGTNYGAGANPGQLSDDGGAGDINAPAAGLYYIEADLEEMTYVLVPLTSVSLIGEAVGGWDAGDDKPLTYNAATKTWSTILNIAEAGKPYKIRFNNGWESATEGYNCTLGGKDSALVIAGDNLTCANEGITGFTLSIFDYPYMMTVGEIVEDMSKLYVVNSTNNWDYMSTPLMTSTAEDIYEGVADFTGATTPQIILSRMQTPLGTRYGGTTSALVEYPSGTEDDQVVKIDVAAGIHLFHADLAAMTLIDHEVMTVGVYGDAVGQPVATAVALTSDGAGKWTVTHTFVADGSFKVAFDNSETATEGTTELKTTLGGSCKNLQIGGGDLIITQGEHTLELNMTVSPMTLAIDGEIVDISLTPDYLQVTGKFATFDWNTTPTPKLVPFSDTPNRFGSVVDMYQPAGVSADMEFKITFPEYTAWMGGQLQEGTTYIYDISGSDGDNISQPYGLYLWDVTINPTAKTGVAKAIPVTSVDIIGQIGASNWDADTPMTSMGEGLYSADVTINGEFKIRFNGNWDYSVGNHGGGALTPGTEAELYFNGGNFTVPSPGAYTVTANLAGMPNTITVVAK